MTFRAVESGAGIVEPSVQQRGGSLAVPGAGATRRPCQSSNMISPFCQRRVARRECVPMAMRVRVGLTGSVREWRPAGALWT